MLNRGFNPALPQNCPDNPYVDHTLHDDDYDGLANFLEAHLGTDPLDPDSDADGMDEYFEYLAGLNPLINDSALDPDADGLTNLDEYQNGGFEHSNPHDPDTDHDGVLDNLECPTCSPLDQGRARLTPDPAFGPKFAFTLSADTIDSGSTVEIASPFFQLHDGAAFLIVLKSDAGHSFIYSTTASAGQILFDPYAADLNGNYLASGAYSVTIYQDFVGLIFSGSRTIDLRRFLYIHSGSQGPVLATSDGKSPTVIWRRGYLAFGEDLNDGLIPRSPGLVNLGFVGRQEDPNAGLYQLGARWYNPDLGRFASVDPVSGSLNQYTYAGNNPFRWQDASGRQWDLPGYAQGYSWSCGNAIGNECPPDFTVVKSVADIGTSFAPGVNDIRDVQECFSGYDIFALQELEWYWQAGSCVGIVAGNASAIKKISLVGAFAVGIVKKADDVPGIVRVAEEAAKFPKLGRKADSAILAANLVASGIQRPPSSAAHHIIAGESRFASEAREILQHEGVDINEAANGIFLLQTKHYGMHTKGYYEEINSRLRNAPSGSIRKELQKIGVEIMEGTFPY